MADDPINPAHYRVGKIQPIEAIDDWKLGFSLGNAVKYIARAAHKGTELECLKKARWYLNHRIEELEAQKSKPELRHLEGNLSSCSLAASASRERGRMLATSDPAHVTCAECRDALTPGW